MQEKNEECGKVPILFKALCYTKNRMYVRFINRHLYWIE